MSPILLRGARVITMSPGRPDAERIDVLIEDDRIADIGEHLDRPGAETIDLSGRIMIPGLVNAHLHTWQTALRGVAADFTLPQYFACLHQSLSQHSSPGDIHIATLAGSLNQINCGTTTLGDWSHNNRTPEHADAAVEALQDSGIRAVFLHGNLHLPPDVAYPVTEIDRLLSGPGRSHPLVSVGMAIKGPQLSTPDIAVADLLAAKERGVVVSMHHSFGEPAPGWDAVRAAGLLGPRNNVVHGEGLTEEWIARLIDAGVTFTVTPENELGQGHGQPITGQLLRGGGAPSLGTDTETVVSGEVLTAARVALAHQRGLDHYQDRQTTKPIASTPSITSKQALSWATVEGARALGLTDRVGRIEAGLQADLVAIDARALNLWPAHDPIATALQASLANIEAVMIAGRWRKRDHALVDVDLDTMQGRLLESGQRILRQMP